VLGASLLGVAAAVAILLDHAWFPAVPPARRGAAELTGIAALAMGFAHLVHGPVTAWLIGWSYQQSSTRFAANAAELRQRFGDPAEAEAYVLRGMGGSFFLPFAIDPHGAPPARWRILGQTGHVLALRRDAHTIDLVSPKGQSIFPMGPGNLFRDQTARVNVGDRFTLPGLVATVLEVGAEGPRVVRFELDRDLDAAPNRWLTETSGGFPEASLPPLGFGQPFDP
jgi:hypothetical protein